MSHQLWIINGQLVYSGNPLPFPDGQLPSRKLNYAFYNEQTGDVWGKRIYPEGGGTWIFTPGHNNYPDIRLPYEIAAGFLPSSYFLFLLDHFISRQNLTS